MKKAICLLLCLVLSCLCLTGLAEGGMEIVETSYYFIPFDWGHYCYCFAKVVNNGTEAVSLDQRLFELVDAEGNVIASENYAGVYPAAIEPGTSAYLRQSIYDFEGVPADVKLTVTEDQVWGNPPEFIDAVSELDPVTDEWGTSYYLYATVTNQTDETVYNILVVIAVTDSEGKLLYVASESMYEIGLTPGSTVVFRDQMPQSLAELLVNQGIDLSQAKTDVIACFE